MRNSKIRPICYSVRERSSSFLFMRNINTILGFLMLISSCSPKPTSDKTEIYDVQILQTLEKSEKALLSQIIDGEVEYIPLESKKEILLGKSPRVFATDLYIIATTEKQIYLFDRTTGKFIREVAHYGNDPGGYRRVLLSLTFDEKRQVVYTGSWDSKNYATYNLKGNIENEIKVQPIEREEDMANNIFGEMITSIAPLNDTSYVGYVWNINGKQEAKLVVFNDNNPRIKVFPQYKRFDYDINRDGISIYKWNAKYYQLDDQLHFFERFTDTVYTVSMDTLQPEYILHRGETENASGTNLTSNKGDVPYLLVEDLFGAERFLFFKIRKPNKESTDDSYYGLFDKASQSTRLTKDNKGIENDVDNFLPFPFKSVNQNNEVAGLLEAFEVKLWFDENPEKASKLSPDLRKLKDIDENDNPIVMIAKLKE